MERHDNDQVLHVIHQSSRRELFKQSLRPDWFTRELVARTAWAASLANPELRTVRVEANVEAIANDDAHVIGWRVALSANGRERFHRQWPLSVLHSTALSVGRQFRPWFGESSVLYWVALERQPRAERPADLDISFEDEDLSNSILVPDVATYPTGRDGKLIASATTFPTEVVLELAPEAYKTWMSGLEDPRGAEVELAWAGHPRIAYRAAENCLVYRLEHLRRLAAPAATATLCPIAPEELLHILGSDRPVLFAHTHIVGQSWPSDFSRYLQPSHDDQVCFRRLPVGSLNVIAGSRGPLRVRAYGWPTDARDLTELATAVTVTPT